MATTSVSLLLRLRDGSDAAAWERFVDLYTPLMVRWAAQLGAKPHDAADLVQDLMLHVLRIMPRFEYDAERSFRAWLRTVLTNKWRDVHRRKRPQAMTESGLEATAAVVEPAWDDASDRAALCREALELIRPEFQPATWSAFVQTTFDGRPVPEVAAELQLTPNAIYLARGRVMRRLRQELEGLWE